jgi:hypothetical protein
MLTLSRAIPALCHAKGSSAVFPFATRAPAPLLQKSTKLLKLDGATSVSKAFRLLFSGRERATGQGYELHDWQSDLSSG